jgi:hypothetical protein
VLTGSPYGWHKVFLTQNAPAALLQVLWLHQTLTAWHVHQTVLFGAAGCFCVVMLHCCLKLVTKLPAYVSHAGSTTL